MTRPSSPLLGVSLCLAALAVPARAETPRAPSASTAPTTTARPLFTERTSVRYDELVAEIRRVADELTQTPSVQEGYRALLAAYDLTPGDVSLSSYSRVRLVFEATRDGGLWGVRWAVTDRMPWSDAIWQQWRGASLDPNAELTATAECDELSALFALLARDVGIDGFVGLHWPAWNHTVAVWQLERGANPKGKSPPVRVLVPTSQIWLSRQASLGTREMKTGRVVFPYARKDLKPSTELPATVARFLIERLERYGPLSTAELSARRNRLGGS